MTSYTSFTLKGILATCVLFMFSPLLWAQSDTTDKPEKKKKNQAQTEEKQPLKNIQGHVLDVEDNGDFSTFEVLDSVVEGKKLIFSGEDHRFEKFNTRLELKLTKYLHQKGFRYYLLESGFASAWMLNKLITGDTAIGQVQQNFYSYRFEELFEGIKEYNKTLDTSQRIVAVGLDVERNVPIALKMLTLLLPEKPVPDSLGLFVESLKIIAAIEEEKNKKAKAKEEREIFKDSIPIVDEIDLDEDFDENHLFYFNLINTVEGLVQEYRGKEEELRDWIGAEQELFNRVIIELERWLVWIEYERKDMPQSWAFREQYMENNLKRFYRENPDARCFGQFGRCHITRITEMRDCSFAFFNSLTNRVKKSVPQLGDSILSIGVFYPENNEEREWRDNGNIKELSKLAKKDAVTIFTNLEGYVSSQLSDKFNMVIIMRDLDYSREVVKYPGDTSPRPASKKKIEHSGMEFNVLARAFDLKGLNTFLGHKLQANRVFYEFGFFNRRNAGFSTKSSFSFSPKEEMQLSDTAKVGLSFGSYKLLFGYDLMKPVWFDLVPYLGFGFDQANLYYERLTGSKGMFGENSRNQYQNPAFIVDGRLEMNFNIKALCINLVGGYIFDVSKKQWKQDSDFVNESPGTTLSGYYAGVGFSLSFDD